MSERQKITVLAITEYEDGQGETRTRWRRIGAAFENDREDTPGGVGRNGGSITVLIDALPLSAFKDGELRLQLRVQDDDRNDRDRNDHTGSTSANHRGGSRGRDNQRR